MKIEIQNKCKRKYSSTRYPHTHLVSHELRRVDVVVVLEQEISLDGLPDDIQLDPSQAFQPGVAHSHRVHHHRVVEVHVLRRRFLREKPTGQGTAQHGAREDRIDRVSSRSGSLIAHGSQLDQPGSPRLTRQWEFPV